MDHLSPSHTLLLNKFNVVEHHLLVVTRSFEPQLQHLNINDFAATLKTIRVGPLLGKCVVRTCSGSCTWIWIVLRRLQICRHLLS